jgi:hypothetical protein
VRNLLNESEILVGADSLAKFDTPDTDSLESLRPVRIANTLHCRSMMEDIAMQDREARLWIDFQQFLESIVGFQ